MAKTNFLSERKIKLEYKKAFEYISKKVEEELAKQNYTKQKVSNEDGSLRAKT